MAHDALRLECARLRRENDTLRAFGNEARTVIEEIAFNPFVDLEGLRAISSRLLAPKARGKAS
jgi:hypothetical protein